MTQNSTRKEPTFGEPSVSNAEKPVERSVNIVPSLRTKTAPIHTFTPVLKRPEATKPKEENIISESAKVEPTVETRIEPTFEPKVEARIEPKVEFAAEKAEQPKGFTFTPTEDKAMEGEKKSVAQETVKVTLNAADRIVPTANSVPADSDKKAKDMKKSSVNGKRLGLVALLAAILGGVFFWLKPSTPNTVEELQQQQGGSLPIEFRPVDENEAKKAEAEAKAQAELQAQQTQQQQLDAQAQAQRDALAELQAKSQAAQAANQVAQQAQLNGEQVPPQPQMSSEQMLPQTQNNATQVIEQPAVQPIQAPQITQPVTATPLKSEPVVKPQTVQQDEKKAAQNVRKVEKVRPTQMTVKAMTSAEFNAKKAQNAQMDKLVQSVTEEKNTTKTASNVVQKATPTATSAANEAVSSKTMTVPKSTSLMQVFRDNNLNISDVNAMSKVNKAVSGLKANEKVTVRLDKNNRVVEMNIGSGGKYIRQADGSYSYK